MNINEAWILLQNKMQNGAKDTAVSRIEWKHKNSDLWLGLNMSGQPFIAIESSNSSFENNLDLQKFISFDLDIVERFSKKFIEIKLSKSSFKDHFIVFIKDLVEYAEECKSEEKISEFVVERIESWDLFFSREKNTVLSQAELLGLWGELEFIHELFNIAQFNQLQIIESWQAASGLDKDFRFKKASVEVKASIARKKAKFTISSEIQLESDSEKPLYLIGYILSPDAKNSMTINNLIEVCRAKITNQKALAEFDLKILKRGLLDSDKPYYENFILGISKSYYFLVTKNFPCLTKSMLQNSISNVQYDIDPELCADFSVVKEEVLSGIN